VDPDLSVVFITLFWHWLANSGWNFDVVVLKVLLRPCYTVRYYYYYNCFMAVWILCGTTRVSWYQKNHSPSHTYRGYQSFLICFLHLLRSMASSMLNIHACQSFCTISPTFLWSTSWPGTLHFILHTFLHRVVVFFFCRTGPYHHNLFCCSTEIMSSNPSLSVSTLYLEF